MALTVQRTGLTRESKLKLDVMKERLPRRASLINSGARRTVDRCGRRL
jgi:hypothetical protein